MGYSEEYKQKVIQEVLDGKSIDSVAKERHHGWKTIEKWLIEYGHIQAEDEENESVDTFHDPYESIFGVSKDQLEKVLDDNRLVRSIKYHEDKPKCIECIRLQAKLEASEALVDRLFKMIGV